MDNVWLAYGFRHDARGGCAVPLRTEKAIAEWTISPANARARRASRVAGGTAAQCACEPKRRWSGGPSPGSLARRRKPQGKGGATGTVGWDNRGAAAWAGAIIAPAGGRQARPDLSWDKSGEGGVGMRRRTGFTLPMARARSVRESPTYGLLPASFPATPTTADTNALPLYSNSAPT